ncbi:hypothetical protein M0R88_08190 [Halorussus gelatinilyticus]|uniref:Uncharacterized protein n=1 Tax=Halorussus gelatinilyticus TaxID=2937524 RepID=A0A8U0IN86_9EURY|nr:hypothetical protein [Halorussus gelatinilyticus]UPW02061.1 hypothetical protein M0R88_08190 [Halorussus gelatinilyticus]
MSQSPLSQATDDRLSQMLFQGEEVEEEFTVEGARVAVTTHRVLVFTPDGDGRRFDHADRPNVLDASIETTGKDAYVGWGVRAGVYGAVLFGGGILLKTSGVLDGLGDVTPPADAPGAGIAQLVSLLPKALGMLTTVLLVGGGLLVVVALALVGVYFSSRERELVIERAGRDPMRVPVRDDDAEDIARRLRAAVGTSSKPRSD